MPLATFILNVIATLWFGFVAFVEYQQHGFNWRGHEQEWMFCFASFVMFIGSEQWSQWDDRQGATRSHIYTTPPVLIRWIGAVCLVVLSAYLLAS